MVTSGEPTFQTETRTQMPELTFGENLLNAEFVKLSITQLITSKEVGLLT